MQVFGALPTSSDVCDVATFLWSGLLFRWCWWYTCAVGVWWMILQLSLYLWTGFNLSSYLWIILQLSLYLWTGFNLSSYLWILLQLSLYLWTGFNLSSYLWIILQLSLYLWTCFFIALMNDVTPYPRNFPRNCNNVKKTLCFNQNILETTILISIVQAQDEHT